MRSNIWWLSLPEYPNIFQEILLSDAFVFQQNGSTISLEEKYRDLCKARKKRLGTFTKGKLSLREMAEDMLEKNPGTKKKSEARQAEIFKEFIRETKEFNFIECQGEAELTGLCDAWTFYEEELNLLKIKRKTLKRELEDKNKMRVGVPPSSGALDAMKVAIGFYESQIGGKKKEYREIEESFYDKVGEEEEREEAREEARERMNKMKQAPGESNENQSRGKIGANKAARKHSRGRSSAGSSARGKGDSGRKN